MTERINEPGASELELQRRWAESHWPVPFLRSADGGAIRVIAPGLWNRGPGPDFRGAQILDREGRARRGDVELHLEPGAWLAHGHADDPAYRGLLLHVVEGEPRPRRRGTPLDPRIPAATPLPAANAESDVRPPCADIVQRAGGSAVETRLTRIARARFLRKAGELRALSVPPGPGTAEDRRASIAAARALGQPHNGRLTERAARLALTGAEGWPQVDPVVEGDGWRRGRGALGSAAGCSLVLRTLLRRWTTPPDAPWPAFERLAALPLREAIGELRITRQFGRGRAIQLLADAVYPLAGSWRAWSQLPGARYQRSDDLRARLDGEGDGESGADRAGLRWRHPQTQALLELEQTRCRQWACQICPLAALAGPPRRALRAG